MKCNIIPIEKWVWYGRAAHFCCANKCLFHLATTVGKYMVSTVGAYYPNMNDLDFGKLSNISCNKKYETLVFKTTRKKCECGCGMPQINLRELDIFRSDSDKDASKCHIDMCVKWSKKQ